MSSKCCINNKSRGASSFPLIKASDSYIGKVKISINLSGSSEDPGSKDLLVPVFLAVWARFIAP